MAEEIGLKAWEYGENLQDGIIIKNLPDQAGFALLSCHIYHK